MCRSCRFPPLLNGSTWLVCTRTRGGGHRLPFLITPRFGVLLTMRAVVVVAENSRDLEKEAGTAGSSGRRSPGGIQLQRRRPGESAARRKSLVLAFAHSCAHTNTRLAPYVAAIAAESMQNPPRNCHVHCSAAFQFPLFALFTTHTRAHSILNSQAPVNQSDFIAFAFLELRVRACASARVSTTVLLRLLHESSHTTDNWLLLL